MRNITGMIGRYLSGVSLPSMNIIDIIEIMLIAFFVYQFMVWIKFTVRSPTPSLTSRSRIWTFPSVPTTA